MKEFKSANQIDHKIENQNLTYTINSQKINKLINKACHGLNTSMGFSKLNPREKAELVKRMTTTHSLTGDPLSALHILLDRGNDLPELFRYAIKAAEVYVKLKPGDLERILSILFQPSNSILRYQKKILILLLNYFNNNGYPYNPLGNSERKILEKAIENGSDTATAYLLNLHKGNLDTETCQTPMALT